MNNLYDYIIKSDDGNKTLFKGIANNQSKEFNLKTLKDLFKVGKLNGEIYAQDNPKERYIFMNGQEQKNIYYDDLKKREKYIKELLNELDKSTFDITRNENLDRAFKNLSKSKKLLELNIKDFLQDLSDFYNNKKWLKDQIRNK